VHGALLVTAIVLTILAFSEAVITFNNLRLFWIQDISEASVNDLKKRKLIEARYLCVFMLVLNGCCMCVFVNIMNIIRWNQCVRRVCCSFDKITKNHGCTLHLSIMPILHILTSECSFSLFGSDWWLHRSLVTPLT